MARMKLIDNEQFVLNLPLRSWIGILIKEYITNNNNRIVYTYGTIIHISKEQINKYIFITNVLYTYKNRCHINKIYQPLLVYSDSTVSRSILTVILNVWRNKYFE